MNNECRHFQFYAMKIFFSLSSFTILFVGVGYRLLKASVSVAPWWMHFLLLLRGGAVAQTKGNGFQCFSSLEKGRLPAPHTPLLLTVGVHSPSASRTKPGTRQSLVTPEEPVT